MKKNLLSLLALLLCCNVLLAQTETPAAPAQVTPAPAAPAQVTPPAPLPTNIPDVTFPLAKEQPLEKVQNIVQQAARKRGWVVVKQDNGTLRCTLTARQHSLVVDLIPSTTNVIARYVSSVNLKYDQAKGTIHRKYQGWLNNLGKDILVLSGD